MEPTGRRAHQYPNVRAYMTPSPLTIGRDRSLTVARRLMQEQGIRHLPVLDGGALVGLLSERDVFLVESLAGANPTEVRVEEAMAEDVLTTTPDAPLAEIVEEMVQRKAGSAVVVEHDKVVGVLTTIDALSALLDRLTSADQDAA